MKSFAVALSILLIMFIIGSNALSSSNALLIKQRKESYQACVRLRNKAPNLNLQCENLLENLPTEKNEKIENPNTTGVKILSDDVTGTRKVNKSEEIKLRNLIKKLSSENKIRTD